MLTVPYCYLDLIHLFIHTRITSLMEGKIPEGRTPGCVSLPSPLFFPTPAPPGSYYTTTLEL